MHGSGVDGAASVAGQRFSGGRSFPRRHGLAALFVLALLFFCTPNLGTEQVTLFTTYPSPSGVYTKIITTGDTYLASAAGVVGIGTVAPNPRAKLHVKGDVIIEGNLLMTGIVSGYRPEGAAEAQPAMPRVSVAAPPKNSGAAPTSATSGLYGLCQELLGFPTPAQMTCRKKMLTIYPASCDPVASQLRCACPADYELVALSISTPLSTLVDPKNRPARGLEALLNDRLPMPVVTYSCLKNNPGLGGVARAAQPKI